MATKFKKNSPGCGCCGAAAPTVTLTGCGCSSTTLVPATIYFKSSNTVSNFGIYQDATLVYGPAPAPFNSGFGFTGNNFWSTTQFTDTNGNVFYYYIICSSSAYSMNRAITVGAGAPALGAITYSWSGGGLGNPCSPWYQLNGAISGGTATKNYLSGIAGDWRIGQDVVQGNVRTSGFVAIAGAVVTIAGVSATSDSFGDYALLLPQSASGRGYTCVATGHTTATGTLAGKATDATVPQWDLLNVVM